ncbi:MAG TPA: DUF72 domain-containing protein [Herpetosiphonaceae bacterium]
MSQSLIHLGTSGWSYDDWVGPFYPTGTTTARYLAVYAQQFNTVEIDATFYRSPSLTMIKAWRERTPADFVFAAKVPRSITHDRELVDVEADVQAFAEIMRKLGDKCGPLLFQFAPSFTAEHFADLAALLPALPSDLRWAVELRHKSWLSEPLYDLLRAHNVALAHVDLPWMPRTTPVTADFGYIRWLGDRRMIADDFSYVRPELERAADLDWWARQIGRMLERGLHVFAYANNHYQGHSPATIRAMQARLHLPVSAPQESLEQSQLF